MTGSRLRTAAERLLSQQLDSGAWGQRPGAERGNTIATAQALTVLQRAGFPGWHSAIERAVSYLANSALTHARDVEEGGRGSYVRYVIHSLAGLLEFPEAVVASEELIEARDEQLQWLLQRQTYGGWPDSPADPISSLGTAQALQVVRRARGPGTAIRAAEAYLLNVRNPRGYWGMKEWGPGSAAVTAECMIALRGLSAEVDTALEASARWLEGNQRLWLRQVERHPITGETWNLASFASASLALAPYGAEVRGIAASIEYVEELWHDESGGWCFPGETHASPKGAMAAIGCFEAVLMSWPLDRVANVLAPSAFAEPVSGGGAWKIELRDRPNAVVQIEDFDQLVPLRPRLWDLLDALEREARHQSTSFPRRDRIAAVMGLSAGSLSKELTRLNECLATVTDGRLSQTVTAAGSGRCRPTGEISRPSAPARLGTGPRAPDGRTAAGG